MKLLKLISQFGKVSNLQTLMLATMGAPRVSGLDVLKPKGADSRTRLLPVVMLTSAHAESDHKQRHYLGANRSVCLPGFGEFTEYLARLATGLNWPGL